MMSLGFLRVFTPSRCSTRPPWAILKVEVQSRQSFEFVGDNAVHSILLLHISVSFSNFRLMVPLTAHCFFLFSVLGCLIPACIFC